jgi:isocitrate dehydrogenase
MRAKALAAFIDEQIADARSQNVLFSLHLKATMMKVSDPIMFGIVVKRFYADVLAKHAAVLDEAGFDANNGIGDLVARLPQLPEPVRAEIEADLAAQYAVRPGVAMVNSDKGITNLHVPSDVIVDASMPAMIRDSGGMWNAEGKLQDAKAVIPDRCYAGIYQVVIDDCKANGAFDPASMGSVPNVGLMAQQADGDRADRLGRGPGSGDLRHDVMALAVGKAAPLSHPHEQSLHKRDRRRRGTGPTGGRRPSRVAAGNQELHDAGGGRTASR